MPQQSNFVKRMNINNFYQLYSNITQIMRPSSIVDTHDSWDLGLHQQNHTSNTLLNLKINYKDVKIVLFTIQLSNSQMKTMTMTIQMKAPVSGISMTSNNQEKTPLQEASWFWRKSVIKICFTELNKYGDCNL